MALAEIGRALSAVQLMGIIGYQQGVTRAAAGWWESGFDLLLTPTLGEPPPALGSFLADPDEPRAVLRRATPTAGFTAFWNADRPAGDLAAAALERRRTPDRRPAGRRIRQGGPAARGGGAARAGKAMGRADAACLRRSSRPKLRRDGDDLGRDHGDGDAVRRRRASRRRGARAGSRDTWPTHGSHGLVLAGTTGESPTLADDEKLRAAARGPERARRGADVDLRHGLQRHPPLCRAHPPRGRGRRRRRARRDAVLQQAEPGRPARPLRGRGRGGGRHSGRPLQHPLALRDQPAARPARRAGANRQRGRGQAGEQRRAGADRGSRRAGGQRRDLPALPRARGGPGGSWSPRIWSGPEMREVYDAAIAGELDRAREIESGLHGVYEALDGDLQPDPGQGRARDARGDRRRGCGCRWSRPTSEQRAAVRAALERQGLLAASAG